MKEGKEICIHTYKKDEEGLKEGKEIYKKTRRK